MRTVFLASLWTHTRRYVAAAIAVIVAVAFVVVIGVLTAGAKSGLMDNAGSPYRGADHVVDAPEDEPSRGPSCCPGTLDTSDAIALVDRLGDNASGLGRVLLAARAGDWRGDTTVGPIAAGEQLRWQKLVSGRFPERAGEAVVHVWDAQAREIAIGDRIRVGEGAAGTDLAVVGLVESPSTWTQASVYVTWPQYVQWRDQPTFHVVGIANTLGLSVLERAREHALLRALGLTRGQLRRMLAAEAALLSVAATLSGTTIGVAFAWVGYETFVKQALTHATMRIPWPALGVVVLLAALAGLLASVLPARRAARVTPAAGLSLD
ncbi:ABC transporter permease [Pseudonocardia sp. DLS-67]